MRLLLIRHGQTDANIAHQLCTRAPGPSLNLQGVRQAVAAAATLKELIHAEPSDDNPLGGARVSVVISSDRTRAEETAEPISAALGTHLLLDRGVGEVAAGDLELRNDETSIHAYLRVLRSWENDLDVATPGADGETGHQALGRFDDAIRDALEEADDEHDTIVVVAHGGIIRAWVAARCDNVAHSDIAHMGIANTGMAVLRRTAHPHPFDGQGWHCEKWHGTPLGGDELDNLPHHSAFTATEDMGTADMGAAEHDTAEQASTTRR